MKKSPRKQALIHTHLIFAYKMPLFTCVLFTFYLLTVPHLVVLTIPCLKPIPGHSYLFDECRVIHALDRYLVLALSGFGLSVLLLFLFTIKSGFKSIIATAIILAILTIIMFHTYIPRAEIEIRRAPILLEGIR